LRESLPGDLDVAPRSPSRLLLESMQHVHRFGAPGNVNYPVCAALVRRADLLGALADRGHGLEVVGLLSALHLFQLIARIVPRILRKFAQASSEFPRKHTGFMSLSISE
jgi:hypothetical protein